MKLQLKLALYNTITKIAIIAVLAFFILIFMNSISVNHIQQRLIDKKNKLVSNLSDMEINDLLTHQKTFTDYNILKEEYIILKQAENVDTLGKKESFSQEEREIEGNTQEYQILTEKFVFEDRKYQLEIGETMAAVEQLEHTILYFTLFILIVSVGLSLIADFAFTRFLLAPFYRIIDQKLNKVDDPMHYDYEPVKTSTQDFRELDASINSLMAKIADIFLIEKQFIANVSHELLTPISILNTRLENLLNDEQLSREGENKLFASLKTLNRLKAIINSLLLISRVENNQFSKTDEISIIKMITEVHEELEDRLTDMNLSFGMNLSEDFIFTGNKSLIHILLMNLINNAIKYNRQQGSIQISGKKNDEQFELIISDTGLGMKTEEIEKAFSRFEKLQSEKKDSYGLGLAIVRSIAAFHQIKIDIKSDIDKGTRVHLYFSL